MLDANQKEISQRIASETQLKKMEEEHAKKVAEIARLERLVSEASLQSQSSTGSELGAD